MDWRAATRGWLGGLGAARWAALVGFVVALPSVMMGFIMDDHIHRLMLHRHPDMPWRGADPWDLFRIVSPDGPMRERSRALGLDPWWSSDDFFGVFFRPLSSLTHALDARLWPDTPALMHLHSALWYALVVALGAKLLSRLMPPQVPAWVVGLALWMYAVDDNHATPAGWLANRNALLATAFGFLAVWAHARWRQDGWRLGAWLGPAALGVGLGCAEFALGALGLVMAFEVCLRGEAGWRSRLAGVAPYGAVVVVWRLLYNALGYGASGSALYIDPARSPWFFARELPERLTLLLQGQWTPASAEFTILIPQAAKAAWWAAGAATVGLVVAALWPWLKASAHARFWGLGLLLGLVPSCATFPHDRLTFLVGLGGSALTALWVAPLWADAPAQGQGAGAQGWGPPLEGWRRSLGWIMVLLHVALSPASLAWKMWVLDHAGPTVMAPSLALDDGAVRGRELVIPVTPDMFMGNFVSIWRASSGRALPATTHVLSQGLDAVVLERVDERTVRLTATEGFLGGGMSGLVRDPRVPFARGERHERGGAQYSVLEVTPDGRPQVVEAKLPRPLDDPALLWLRWSGFGFLPFDPPKTGERVTLDVDERLLTECLFRAPRPEDFQDPHNPCRPTP